MKTTKTGKPHAEKEAPANENEDTSASYDAFKSYKGKRYTGMAVGRSHKWYYDKGEWKETKITPELWAISYAVTKRRAGKAPKGSGAAVGTAYHWYIVAHQNVEKLNANDYTTNMSGLKFKVAHKRASSGKWSLSAPSQRTHLARFLREVADQLEREPIPIELELMGKKYKGEALPVLHTCENGVPAQLDITLNNEHIGIIRHLKSGWKMELVEEKALVKAIGKEIDAWYEFA